MISTNEIYSLFKQYPVVTTDSRNIPFHSLFFALKGENFDGNNFAEQALQNGAAYAIVDNEKYKNNNAFIFVEDALTALQDLARYHRQQFRIPVLAITGTNGKTTTKELISSVLSTRYNIIATEKNLNNHIGVPLTLLRIHPGTDLAVIEMGANHPGEIAFLSLLAAPTHGIITNIGKAHLEGFGSFDGVINAKTELYRYLHEHHGTVFINSDNPLLMEHLPDTPAITYGSKGPADLTGNELPGDPLVSVKIDFPGSSRVIHSRLFGKYNTENILAAACIGQYFKVPPENIREAIEGYIPDNNRSQIKKTGRNLLILDAYNANPSSMKEAITHFASASLENKILILGDMLELGDDCDEEHKNLLTLIKELEFPSVFLVGPVFTRICREIGWMCFQDVELAQLWFEHHPLENQSILIKGSRGIKLEKLIELL